MPKRPRKPSARLWALVLGLLSLLAGPQLASAETTQLERRLGRLVAAYPDFLAGIDGNALLWKDGTRMAIDDGRGGKPFELRLADPDIKDMFWTPYPQNAALSQPDVDADPGRVRYQPFFDKMYGDCSKGSVQASLVEIVWLPSKARQPIKITSINGVAERLDAVSRELDRLPATFDAYLFPAAGTFNCRPIAGTSRPSAHGHGIAIDIALRHAHYWRWSQGDGKKAGPQNPGAGAHVIWRNSIPPEIVAIFEKHGFIWGGRWYHYDTMHFEYRPELLD